MSDRPVEHWYYNPDEFPLFWDPQPSPSFKDVMHEVSGRTRSQKHLVTIAQAEMCSCLLADEHVICRLQAWSASVSLPAIENDIAGLLDRVAQCLDLPHRGKLIRTRPIPRTVIEDFLPEWCTLQDRLYAAYRRMPEVLEAACSYVRDELQQPWPWLAFRLADHVFEQAWERALGIKTVRSSPSYMADDFWDRPAQHFRSPFARFETRPDETVAEAIQRRMAEALEDCKNLQASEQFPKGVLRKDREDNVRRHTKWLYRWLTGGREIYPIARSYHQEQQGRRHNKRGFPRQCGCPGNVRKGIRDACKLLEQTPYRFGES